MVEIVKQNFRKNKHKFRLIKKQLQKDLNKKIAIEHVGSTAIPNMYGKNIVDILIGAEDINEFNYIKRVLEKNGFYCSKKSKNKEYQFFASRAEETKDGDVHIHLALKGTQRYEDFILLKNYLLKNKNEIVEYSNFKRNLINNKINEREEYKKAKSEYVSKLIQNARRESTI